MKKWRALLVGVVGAVTLGAGVAQACSIDGVPSLLVNNRFVAVNTARAGNASFDTWAPFVARGVYPARQLLRLQEDHARIAQALPPEAFRYSWRWRFGDGTSARGSAVSHAYRRPGTYIISVDAYLVAGAHKLWFTFDKATLTIR